MIQKVLLNEFLTLFEIQIQFDGMHRSCLNFLTQPIPPWSSSFDVLLRWHSLRIRKGQDTMDGIDPTHQHLSLQLIE